MNNIRPLRIALTKGRLENKSIESFEKNGIDCTELRNKGRKLVFSLNFDGIPVDVILVKSVDVITYVENGFCDIGIVGKDSILEYGKHFYEVKDLQFGKCKIVFAGMKCLAENPDLFYKNYGKKLIATKFENIARNYFTQKNIDVDIIKIESSVEIAPVLGFTHGIVDIVETGTTLKENGLEIIDVVTEISARAIVNIAAMKMRKQEILHVISKF